MNYVLIIQGLVAALDLAIRIAESRGYDPAELEQYIEQRNALREALVQHARELGDQNDPADEPQVADEGPYPPPDETVAPGSSDVTEPVQPPTEDEAETPQSEPEETADETASDPNKG